MYIKSWANGIFTYEGGSHEDGVKKALRKVKLKPKAVLINAVLDHPRFGAPTKSRLVSEWVEEAVEQFLVDYFRRREVPQ